MAMKTLLALILLTSAGFYSGVLAAYPQRHKLETQNENLQKVHNYSEKERRAWRAAYFSFSDASLTNAKPEDKEKIWRMHDDAYKAYREVMNAKEY